MRQVKGTMLVNIVKGIRANKSGVYDKIIDADDKVEIAQKILNGAWYPFNTYKNCANAVAQVEAKGNMEIVKNWGRDTGELLMQTIYKSAIAVGNPEKAWASFNRLFKLWFNFGQVIGEFVSDTEIHISFNGFDTDFETFYYIALGWFESFFELILDKKVESKFLTRSWEGDHETKFSISWS